MESLIQNIFDLMGLPIVANTGDVLGVASFLVVFLAALGNLFGKTSKTPLEEESLSTKEADIETPAVEEKAEVTQVVEEKIVKVTWSERLKNGLSRSRQEVWGRLHSVLSGKILDDETLEEVEELLYTADIGTQTVGELIEVLENKIKSSEINEDELKKFLFEFLKEKMTGVQSHVASEVYKFDSQKKKHLEVIMVVGVNGAGKTTTIGKLATKLTGQGAKVVVGACDTFRAAAVDQLQVWCERAGAHMIRAKEGANPSGVGYDALQEAINSQADYCILDTAGRLHTKGNLMDELTKSKNVLKKLDENAPHHVLLVIDAITGQNALRQAQEFHKALDLTGLIFTKCDGSSKAGSAVSIVEQLKVPITYIGVGEGVEDLDIFNLDDYLGALLDYEVVEKTHSVSSL